MHHFISTSAVSTSALKKQQRPPAVSERDILSIRLDTKMCLAVVYHVGSFSFVMFTLLDVMLYG